MQRVLADMIEPREQLALDEALLLQSDRAERGMEFIRVWSFDRPVVVLGRSSKVDFEVDREFCAANHIPVLRRCSGGAAVVGGAGCLMYSVVLSQYANPSLRKIDEAHRYVIDRLVEHRVPVRKLTDVLIMEAKH